MNAPLSRLAAAASLAGRCNILDPTPWCRWRFVPIIKKSPDKGVIS